MVVDCPLLIVLVTGQDVTVVMTISVVMISLLATEVTTASDEATGAVVITALVSTNTELALATETKLERVEVLKMAAVVDRLLLTVVKARTELEATAMLDDDATLEMATLETATELEANMDVLEAALIAWTEVAWETMVVRVVEARTEVAATEREVEVACCVYVTGRVLEALLQSYPTEWTPTLQEDFPGTA